MASNSQKPYVFKLSLVLAAIIWVIDSVIDALFYNKFLLDTLLLSISSHDVYTRLTTVIAIIGLGAVVSRLLERSHTRSIELQDHQNELNAIIRQIPAILWTTDKNLQLLFINSTFKNPAIPGVQKVSHKTIYEYLEHVHPEMFSVRDHEATLEGESRTYIFQWGQHTLKAYLSPLKDTDGNITGCLGVALDISQQKAEALFLKKANRAYIVLSRSNQALLRASDEDMLLQEICDILISEGGYELAWIAYAKQDESYGVYPVAYAGNALEYINNLIITWDDSATGQGPTGTAIRTGKPRVQQNLAQDSNYRLWRKNALEKGYLSSAALPLIIDGKAIGALNVYASETDTFDPQEVELLINLTSDIAYGIINLRARIEQKRTEAALQESESLFRLLAENARDIIYRIRMHPEQKFEYVSPSATRIVGYTPEDHYNDPLLGYRLVHPDDRWKLSDSELSTENPLTLRWVKKDGRVIWTEQHNTPIFDEKGTLIALEGIARDITRRYESMQTQQRLATIVETTDDAIISKTLDGTITSWNNGASKIYGYKASEIIGKHISKLMAPEHQDEAAEIIEQLLAGSHISHYQTRRVRKDGKLIDVSLTNSLLYDAENNVTGVSVIARDITGQKEAEARLKAAHEQLKNIFDNLDHVFFSIDMQTGQLLQISETCQKVFGVTIEFFQKQPMYWKDAVIPEDKSLIDSLVQEFMRGESVTRVYRIKRPDESIRWIESRIQPVLNGTQTPTRVDGIISDITERRRASRLVVAGEIAAGVAHQINNPMTTVIAETHLLLNKLDPNSILYEAAQDIKAAAYRAAEIVQRLLDLSRNHNEQAQPVKINHSIEKSISLIRSQVTPYLELEPGEKIPVIQGSEDHLQDLWINLILNAKDAISNQLNGKIKIKTYCEQNIIYIQIIDNGPGIPPENLNHIFDPFFTTKQRGAGLGLSICHDVAMRHHGTIHVDSQLNTGTTFTVILPVQ